MVEKLNRRDFLKMSALTAVSVAVASCAKTTEPTEAPKATATTKAAESTATPESAGPLDKQAPMLIEQINAGSLPPLDERLTANPLVLEPVEEIGEYGGTWRHTDVGMGMSGRQNLASLFFWNRDATEVIPDLAATVEIGDGGKTYTFGLREGFKWSDGDPFTADDMVWLYEDVWLNEDLSPNGVSGWLKVGGEPVVVEKGDDYTLSFKFAMPYGLFMLYVAFRGEDIMNTPPEYMKQFHAKYAKKEDLDKMMADASLDTWDKLFWARNSWTENEDKASLRPWVLSEPPRAATTHMGLIRNAYYHKVDPEGNQLPYIDKSRWKRVETAEMIPLSALAGEIDMQLRRIKLSDYPILADGAEKGDYRLILWEGMNTGMVVFPNHNLINDDEVLALNTDVRWRKALSHLMDRDELNELVYVGMAGPPQGCFPESFASEKELWEPFEHNPDKANELLDELGLDKKDADGWRLLPSGKSLILTFEGYSADTDVMAGAELFAAAVQKAGINCAVKGVTNDLWWDRVYSVEYQFVVYLKNNSGALIQAVYPRAYTPVEHSTYWAPEWGNWYETEGASGKEPTGAPRDLQMLFKQVAETVEADKRIELFNQIYHDYLVFFPDIIGVGRVPDPGIVKNNFRNVPEKSFQAWTLKTPALANPEQFFFKS